MNTRVGTKWREFTVGHRISGHEKCGRMHGHNLRVRVEVEGEIDAATGMVVDFGVLSKDLAEIVEPWDHRFLADNRAKLVSGIIGNVFPVGGIQLGTLVVQFIVGDSYIIDGKYVLPKEDVVVLNLPVISSENLAWHILQRLIGKPWAMNKLVRVQVSENGENIAEASHFVQNWSTNTSSVWTSTGQNCAFQLSSATQVWMPGWSYPLWGQV